MKPQFIQTKTTRPLAPSAQGFHTIPLANISRWLAIGAFASPYWNRVRHGQSTADIPSNTHYLLWQRTDGDYGILLPLTADDYAVTVSGAPDGVQLNADGGATAAPLPARTPVACLATGRDLPRLITAAMRAAAQRLRTFQLRADKPTPDFVNHLGWCTWNAFYHDVTAGKILHGLDALQQGGITPGYILLDDGWQDVRRDQLHTLNINQQRFPGGLRPLTQQTRAAGVKHFGVWHALQGYWLGINPRGPLAKQYTLHREQGVIRPWLDNGDKQETARLLHPKQAARFYTAAHRLLASEGVTLLKVDVQSILSPLPNRRHPRATAMRDYQRALQTSAFKHFNGNLIHCMSNTLDVAHHLAQTTVWRNTDDYIPHLPADRQQEHLHTNALNSLLTATFALPDWDMFQTHAPHAEYHAAARALSGGPVCVSDVPGQTDFTILRRLATADGHVHRPDRPAQPTLDTVFADCRAGDTLLKIHNRAAAAGLLGIFHCSEQQRPLTASYTTSDIPGLRGNDFIARRHSTGKITRLRRADHDTVTLPHMGWEIITLAPVRQGWLAALGQAGKYTGATTLGKVTVSATRATINIKTPGDYLFWCAARPSAVTQNRRPLPFTHNPKTRLLTVTLPTPAPIKLTR